jgi:hypothetical protein
MTHKVAFGHNHVTTHVYPPLCFGLSVIKLRTPVAPYSPVVRYYFILEWITL